MNRIAFAALFVLALAVAPIIAQRGCSTCGGSSSAEMFVAQQLSLRWERNAGEPDRAYLWRGNQQIGGWDALRQKYRPLIDWNANQWGAEIDAAPIPPPADLVRPVIEQATKKTETWQTHGVKVDEICQHERHMVNGVVVSQADARNAITAGVLADDSGKLWLSVWSKDPAKRAAVVADLQKDPALAKWVAERCHLWAGDAASPDHFLAKDRTTGKPLYAFDGDPMISLQAPDGTELWHDAGYSHGPISLQAMRKRDPQYKPDDVPGPSRPDAVPIGMVPLSAAGLALILLLPQRKDP